MSKIYKKFHLSASGGTFDLFHKGHKKFLHQVFKYSKRAVIGITSDKFVSSKKTYESFSDRKNSVLSFLKTNHYKGEIIEIDDIYGPTIDKIYNFDVIFVTKDSLKGAEAINNRRKEIGLKRLETVEFDLIKTSDGKILSSSRIKNGEVDRDGNLYLSRDFLNYDFTLPERLRSKLSKPFGELIKDFDSYIEGRNLSNKFIISVGDITTERLLTHKIIPQLSIVDLIVNRVRIFNKVSELGFVGEKVIEVNNPAGNITRDLISEVKNFFESKEASLVIKVNGEEDLAVIPVILSSPLGCEIYYGQPGEGVVKIIVTEGVKNKTKKLLQDFM